MGDGAGVGQSKGPCTHMGTAVAEWMDVWGVRSKSEGQCQPRGGGLLWMRDLAGGRVRPVSWRDLSPNSRAARCARSRPTAAPAPRPHGAPVPVPAGPGRRAGRGRPRPSLRCAAGRRWDPENKGRRGDRACGGRSRAGARAGTEPGLGVRAGAEEAAEAEAGAWRPGRGAMAAAETKIIYHLDEQETPYLVKLPIPAERVTLGDFKGLLNRPNYKFYFKSMDDDFG